MIGKIETKKKNHKTNGIIPIAKKLNGDEEWDKIWDNPQSYQVLDKLVAEAKEQIKKGEFTIGGFGDL